MTDDDRIAEMQDRIDELSAELYAADEHIKELETERKKYRDALKSIAYAADDIL